MESQSQINFAKLRKTLKGRNYSSDKNVMEAVESWFVDQEGTYFLKDLKALQGHCKKCVELRGVYLE